MQCIGEYNMISEKSRLIFEKQNSKYNRIWEQLTSLSLFFIATFLAWLGVWYDLTTKIADSPSRAAVIQNLSVFHLVTLSYGAILMVITLSVVYLLSHLFRAREKIRELFKKNKMSYE